MLRPSLIIIPTILPRDQGFLKNEAFPYQTLSSRTWGSCSKSQRECSERPSDSYPWSSSANSPSAKPPDASHPPPNWLHLQPFYLLLSYYGILFWSRGLAPHRRGGKEAGCGALRDKALISRGWKIQVHLKRVLGSDCTAPLPHLAQPRSRTLPISSAWKHWAVHKQGLSTFSKTDCTERSAIVSE